MLRRLGRVGPGTALAAAAFALIGVFASVGAHALRSQDGGATRTSAALRTQVEALQGTDARLQAQLDLLGRQTTAANAAAAATARAARVTAAQQAQLLAQIGATAVQGPGITVGVSDAPGAAASAELGSASPGLVTDRDLQAVVNALWASGAEAITVNGQRIGPTSTIRQAGEAILVDFHPIASPYAVSAIGGQDQLQTGLADSSAGSLLHTISSVYGVGVSVRPATRLSMAAAPAPTLFSASPLPGHS